MTGGEDEETVDRLEGFESTRGGLVRPKSGRKDVDGLPVGSKYRLDELAERKRRQRAEDRVNDGRESGTDRDGDVFKKPVARNLARPTRNYRNRDLATPSRTPSRVNEDRGRPRETPQRRQGRPPSGLPPGPPRRPGPNSQWGGSTPRRTDGSMSRVTTDDRPLERSGSSRRDRPLGKPLSRVGWDGQTPRRSAWDMTPSRDDQSRLNRVRATPLTERLPTYVDERDMQLTEDEMKALEEEEARVDREWYLQDDEAGHLYDSTAVEDAGRVVSGNEAEIARKQAKRLSARAAQLHEDANRWEEHQMKLGGVRGSAKELAMDFNEDDGPRVVLLVNETVPPFLEGRLSETTKEDTVVPIRDPTSDMAIVARKGSAVVKVQREKRERSKGRAKFWELGKNLMGAKQKSAEEDLAEKEANEQALLRPKDGDDGGDPSGRKAMQYGESMGREQRRSALEEIARLRRSLPVYTVRSALLQVIRDNQVVIIVGETGSGKTTQLTQYLLEDGYGRTGVVGCTQPRRVAAVSVAKRVAEEMNVELGEEVGYAIRFEDRTSKATKIKYMTDGILLRETLSDADLDNYSCVVMDEAHERSLNTDVLFGVLKKVLSRRRDLRVVVTSATMNADRFADFFGKAPMFNIPGRTYPVDVFYAKSTVEDFVEGAVKQVLQIHLQAPVPGDILVFMTGQEDIEVTCELLAERMETLENPRPLLILPIYSQLAADLQAKIFEPAPEGARKVVVATNIAETSLTVDGVSFVVDSGYCKLKTYNPRIGMDALLLCPTSQASASQRAGRAGRTGPGRAYRLYTANAFAGEMLEGSVPEIQRTNLGHVVLLLKSLGVREILDFDFMDPPPQENIVKSMMGLWMLGALDASGELTELGKRMATFPLDPALSRMLLSGEQEGCSQEVVTIVAMLSVPSVFFRPRDREEEADLAREKFFVPESDHLTLLHVFQRWTAAGSRADWCTKHFLNAKGLRRAKEVRSQLLDVMKDEKVVLNTCGTDWDSIRKAVTSAYFHQAAKMKGIGEYINMRSGVVCAVHPTSALYGAGFTPDYVVYHELIYTQKEYMSCVTVVEPQWLADMGPMFFTIKHAGERRSAPRIEQGDAAKAPAEGVKDSTTPVGSALEAKLERSRKRAGAREVAAPGRRGKLSKGGRLGV